MDIFGSIFGLDITGDGNADMLDDILLIDLIEDNEESTDNMYLEDED